MIYIILYLDHTIHAIVNLFQFHYACAMTIKVYFFSAFCFFIDSFTTNRCQDLTKLCSPRLWDRSGGCGRDTVWSESYRWVSSHCVSFCPLVYFYVTLNKEKSSMMQQLPTFTFISLRVICLPEKLNFKTAQSTLVGIMQSRKLSNFHDGLCRDL